MASYSSGIAFDLQGNKVKEFTGGGDHYGNFVESVRSRDPKNLTAEIEEGHLSSALCHLGNISYHLGSPLSVAEVKDRLQNVKSPEHLVETYERFTAHLADNKLDLETTRLSYGPTLAIDTANETFVDNSTADGMLTREYRAPFVVPAEAQI
jgi:hypothetical protein